MDSTMQCRYCYYFRQTTNTEGICRRYPTFVDKRIRQKCGEFKRIKSLTNFSGYDGDEDDNDQGENEQ